jgi:hypothetical protein
MRSADFHGTGYPLIGDRIFGIPETAVFRVSSVEIKSSTRRVISSSVSGARRISTG